MAKKIFISVLGTSSYGKTIYTKAADNWESSKTHFVQQAALEQIGCQDWNNDDKVYILLTKGEKGSRMRNWVADRKDARSPYPGLEKVLSEMNLPCQVEGVDLSDENDMWKVFNDVDSLIDYNDELYIDLTHAFRYLSMLILVLSNYTKFLKSTKVKYVSYGNYMAGTPSKDDPLTTIAPIIDLLPIVQLQDWTIASADFLNNGYAEGLKKLAQSFNGTTGNDIIDFVNILEKFTIDRQTCRGKEITKGDIRKKLHDLSLQIDTNEIPPLTPILQEIKKRIAPPAGTMEKVVNAAEWCLQNHLWQQSLSILQEGIVTFFCQRHDLNFMKSQERSLINSAFAISFGMTKYRKDRIKWRVKHENLSKTLELLDDELIKDRDNCKTFDAITKLRNNYMHAGYEEGHSDEITPEEIKKVIEDVKCKLLPCIDPDYKPKHWGFRKSVFLNLSNHSSQTWDNVQRKAAEVYGVIVDMQFPDISANIDADKIVKLARKTAKEIVIKFDDGIDLTVHVMGEMTFTYNMVSILKGCGIRCVASCSERVVQNLGDGKRISQFHFSQFREY